MLKFFRINFFILNHIRYKLFQTLTFYILVEPPYLIINNIHDIKKLDGHLALSFVLKGMSTPKKRKIEETS